MRRFTIFLLSIGLSLGMWAAAQAQPAQPAQVPIPGANQAMVRVVHASPETQIERVVLTDVDGVVAHHEFPGIEYLEATEYQPVLAGAFDIVVELAEVEDAPAAAIAERGRINTVVGNYYTIVVTGLALPGEVVGVDDGFLAWLEELFTAERQDLSVFPIVLEDLTHIALPLDEAEVRLVHAAPGVDTLELFFVRFDATEQFLHREAYGNWSPHNRIFPEQGHLQVRIADAVLMDLADVDLEPGMIHTVIVTGTPIEDVPLRAIIVSNPWIDPIAVPAAPGAPVWGWGRLPAAETAWVHDRLFQAQAWLESAEARLAELEAEEEEAAAAREEIAAARVAIEQVHMQFQAIGAPAAPGVAPVQPTEPGVEPVDPEDDEDEEDAD